MRSVMSELGYLQLPGKQNRNSPVRADGKRYWGYPTRSKAVQVIPIHTAETGPTPWSAESIADYFTISTRPASYHEVGDSDSYKTCLPPGATAFGAVGWNSNAWHWSFATRAHLWGRDPKWDEAALRIGAERCRLHADLFGLPYKRITLAQARSGQKGFIDHGRLDPGRRSDPGKLFPWSRFLDLVRDQKEDTMSLADLKGLLKPVSDGVTSLRDRVEALHKRHDETTRLAEVGAEGAVAALRARLKLPPSPESDAIHVERIRSGAEYDMREVARRLGLAAETRAEGGSVDACKRAEGVDA